MLGVALGLLAGCTPRTDPRLATPEGTLETLLSAYALDDLPQAEIRRRLASGRRLSLRDPEAWRICFDDLRTPQDEGVAGFVLGAVATHKDVLRFEGGQDRMLVRSLGDAASDRVIVLRRRPSGWKIVLRESVPREVRRSLYAEYARIAARTP